MAENHFTHLHLHTEFSLLDGAITLEKLIQFAKQHQFKAMGISDHGNIFGAVKFFQQCKKAGIKPILGMEAYFTPDVTVRSAEKKYHHLILIVQNEIGYRNLCKLIAYSFQQGFYFKPRIDYAILERHSEGLIATTACLGGHIPSLLMTEQMTEAEKRIDWFLQVFGNNRFYFEVQPEEQAEQKKLNALLYEWSARKNVPLLATADCHYLLPSDHEAHEVMLSIQTQHKITDPDRFTFGDVRAYVKTAQEMGTIFEAHPQAVWNSGVIADQCDFAFETGKLFFPKFTLPEQETPETFFAKQCASGLETLITNNRIDHAQIDQYRARLQLEVELIITMGFVGYFLVVSDFIQWAKRNGIPVGPGRGSAAGSLVAWALEITNIDPLKYNLLFERFLNPERITMPDIDIDFCIEGRERVIEYVRQKYGHNNVGQIITFGTMMAKGVVKDVARVLGMPFEDANRITDLVPEQLKITLQEAIDQEPRLKELIEQNPTVTKLFDIAFRLEGITRHASKHAAGIVISPEPIEDVLPVYVPPKSTELVTQYAMTELESIGFLKIDLLGLKNLTLIDWALKRIRDTYQVHIDIDALPLDDAKAFALLCAGKTSGVFQLESDGIKEVLVKLQPEKFEDIIAVNALYRPGPLGSGMVEDYIQRRHGKQEIKYLFAELAPILQETYGVIVYQEQVMKIASTIAGYSLGESDILRRAMGKKKAEVMAEQRELFLKRALENKFDGTKAGELFDLMAYFAGYGFNKSHSAAYALIAYQTAYLKAHYPAEFMACLISLEATHPDKMVFYLQEAKDMGIAIIPPDINRSAITFTVVDGSILFGLHGIKNVGAAALESILQERQKKPFADLLDFCVRIDLRTANKRVIESLICAGAFDALPGNRAQKFNELELIIESAIDIKKNKATGQLGLFQQNSATNDSSQGYSFKPLPDWNNKEKLEKERETIGFYLSSHPLDAYKNVVNWFGIQSLQMLAQQTEQNNSMDDPLIFCVGLVTQQKQIVTKKGDRMAFVHIEDASGKAELVIFPTVFKRVEPWLQQYHVFVVKGWLDQTSNQIIKIRVQECMPIELIFTEWPKLRATWQLPASFETELLQSIKQTPSGAALVQLRFEENGKMLALKNSITASLAHALLADLEQKGVKIRLVL
ncbi:MAG: DNA polymerase III subunit alpha [Candidatus Babeliales bacterium]